MISFGCQVMLAIITAAAIIIPISQAQSQGGSGAEAFDVASVRPAAIWKPGGEGSQRSRIEYSPKNLKMWNVDLSDCVQWAYGVKFYQISGKGFPNGERYDIEAKPLSP